MKNLPGSGIFFVYDGVMRDVSGINKYAAISLQKQVKTIEGTVWSRGVDEIGENTEENEESAVNVYEGGLYTYALRITFPSDGTAVSNTVTSDIVVLDSIENYQLTADDIKNGEDDTKSWNLNSSFISSCRRTAVGHLHLPAMRP